MPQQRAGCGSYTMAVVGIDIALQQHRVAILGPDGETVGRSFTLEATAAGFAELTRTLQERGARPEQTVIGLEATGDLWENLEAYLTAGGYRVVVLTPCSPGATATCSARRPRPTTSTPT